MLAAGCLLLASGDVSAQVQRSMVNPSFESPALATAGCRVYIGETRVPGWISNHPLGTEENVGGCVVPTGFGATNQRLMELWRTPRNNNSGGAVDAPDGVQIAELNAAAPSRLYQNVCLISGETFNWRFSHRGRTSPTLYDPANFMVGSALIAQVGTTNTGAFRTPVAGANGTVNPPTNAPGNATWVRYSGTYTYTGATGITALGFEAANAANSVYPAPATGATTDPAQGNLLDAIQIELAPYVDFAQPTSSALESAGNNLPQLRVNGTVYSPMTVAVLITGGTATLGSDYTTSSGASTLQVTIPAGVYDGNSAASLFTLPVTIINDSIQEGNETIQFQIQQSTSVPQAYYRRSSTNCGQQGIIDSVYTIIGDDVQLAVTKNASAPVPVTGQANVFDIQYTMVVTNTSTTSNARYGLQDAPGFDPDVTINAASYTLNGGAVTPLSGTGPWTLQSQWRTLAAGASDTYVLSVRGTVARAGSISQDGCASPTVAGLGLHNLATATLQAQPSNQSFTSSACQPTPTPYWVQLDKRFTARAQSTDQAQVRLYNGGILAASASTSGTSNTVSTGALPFASGTLLDVRETILLSGTTASAPANKYAVSINCSNARTGATTVLPFGSGSTFGPENDWVEMGPLGGDDIACTITNSPKADLSITKSNGVDSVVAGSNTVYTIVVSNNGPAEVTGARLADPLGSGLASCATLTCDAAAATGGAGCPNTATVAALQAGTQTVDLPANSSLTFMLTCSVSP